MVADVIPKVESTTPAPVAGRFVWTVERYLAMVEAGILGPDDRVELLEGEIISKMGQDFPHIDGIAFLVEALRATLSVGFHIRSQLPLRTSDSIPEPDVYVLRGTARDFVGRFPNAEEVVLVAEVANTTLKGDREKKAGIYARAGFAEYWILNVADRQLEIHREPLTTGVYAETRIHGADSTVTLQGRELPVADLLP